MAGLEEHIDDFGSKGARVVAISADPRQKAGEMKQDENLSFPVLYGFDVDADAERFGLYAADNGRTHVQPAQFILNPDGEVRFASYSNGPVGRLTAEDALSQIPD